MKTVYVIIRFRMEENIPIFKDAGIYGEPVLTSIDPLGEVQFMLFPSEGEDFRDAVHNAMLKVRMHPRWRWLLVHIPPERWTLGHVPRGGGE